jgi:hypothetical protein
MPPVSTAGITNSARETGQHDPSSIRMDVKSGSSYAVGWGRSSTTHRQHGTPQCNVDHEQQNALRNTRCDLRHVPYDSLSSGRLELVVNVQGMYVCTYCTHFVPYFADLLPLMILTATFRDMHANVHTPIPAHAGAPETTRDLRFGILLLLPCCVGDRRDQTGRADHRRAQTS